MEGFNLARSVVEVINSTPVQAVLDVSAATADGSDGIVRQYMDDADGIKDLRIFEPSPNGISTNGLVNLFGEVFVIDGTNTPTAAVPETNDNRVTATQTGITGFNSPAYIAQGMIGDNAELVVTPAMDIDVFQVDLQKDDELVVSILPGDTTKPSPRVQVFSNDGTKLFEKADFITDQSFTIPLEFDPTELAQIPDDGERPYFISISSTLNDDYDIDQLLSGSTGTDPAVAGMDRDQAVSDYRIEMEFGIGYALPQFNVQEGRTDINHFRDQGQMVIHSNTILDSAEFGIEVDQDYRTGDIH